jgi:hypothetical protein
MEEGPDVILDVVFEDGLLYLVLANIGPRPARQVATRFNRKLVGLGGTKEISALPLFHNVEFLAPGREIRTLLDSTSSFFARRQPATLVARISYRDEDGRPHEKTIKHDLAIYRELAYVERRE